MNEKEHTDLRSLVGAFALDATDALERRRVERHLSTCDECANEVRMLRETAAELAWLPAPEDADDLLEQIDRKIPDRRRGASMAARISFAVAAVSVVVAGVLGGLFVSERNENAQLADVLASSADQAKLGPQGSFEGRGVLHIAQGKAALILEDLPPAGRDRAYQLWAIKGSKPRSLDVIEAEGRVVRLFEYSGSADKFAVTIEPSGGSPVPTSDPVLVGA